MNADNALLNDTQGETLTAMPSSFELENHVHCFNHTLQLSAKALFHLSNAALGKATDDGDDNGVNDLLDLDDDDEDKDKDKILPYIPNIDDIDNSIDKLDELNEETCEGMIPDTATVHEMVSKLHHLFFAIVQSTTITLPVWCCYCKELKLKSCILPWDVVTWWNSTYYMLSFVIKYCHAINTMTVNKSLKLRNFELEMEEWAIAEDLIAVLLVCINNPHPNTLS